MCVYVSHLVCLDVVLQSIHAGSGEDDDPLQDERAEGRDPSAE